MLSVNRVKWGLVDQKQAATGDLYPAHQCVDADGDVPEGSTTTDEIFGMNNAVIDFQCSEVSMQCFRKWSWVDIGSKKLFAGCPLSETMADIITADSMEDLPCTGPVGRVPMDLTPMLPNHNQRRRRA